MWIKIDNAFMLSQIMTLCADSIKEGDNQALSRQMVFIQLCINSADDISFSTPRALSRFIHMPIKSCERVWEIALKSNVLRPSTDGYNTKEWLIERGYLGNTSTARQAVESKNVW